MRCCCCNRNLNDYESTLKSEVSGDYLDMCTRCLKGTNIATIGREDLNPNEEIDVEFDNDPDIYEEPEDDDE